jgi:putative glutamine amidotransferase
MQPIAVRRPVIAVPARFSTKASALRFAADVIARTLAEAVFAAGGEPFIMHPYAPGAAADEVAVRERLWLADAVLLPGGGDVSSRWYGQPPHPALYDVDEEQDAFDLAVARVALADRLPLLAVCRGTQVVNVALGGNLVQDMAETVGNHRGRMHETDVMPGSLIATIAGTRPAISCHHHQCIDRLGAGLLAVAHADDGVIEAVTLPDHPGWFLGVQWHPEDSAATDLLQASLFAAFVDAARLRVRDRSHGPAGAPRAS